MLYDDISYVFLSFIFKLKKKNEFLLIDTACWNKFMSRGYGFILIMWIFFWRCKKKVIF